jgi:UTP--glucose-1-phosphate uridylyltransferase
MKIRKAVFPVAGFGTRLLPATKSIPKELLPVWDRPILHHVMEEVVAAGITEVLFITSWGKEAILDYFDRNRELEAVLEARGKLDALKRVQDVAHMAAFFSIRQGEIHGLGHAVDRARRWAADEPFAVVLPDDLVIAEKPCLGQLVGVFEKYGRPVVALEEIPTSETYRYGIVAGTEVEPRTYKLSDMVEKPQPEIAPSNLAIIGRYILTPEIFSLFKGTEYGAGGEIQLTDAMRKLIPQGIYGYKFEGKRCDAGTPLGFLETNVAYALSSPSLRPEALNLLKQYLKKETP